jgi:hypothetical protein
LKTCFDRPTSDAHLPNLTLRATKIAPIALLSLDARRRAIAPPDPAGQSIPAVDSRPPTPAGPIPLGDEARIR